MTREEQIQKLIDEETGIDNYGSADYQVGVCDGVSLADKTMIEKSCEWLEEKLLCAEDHYPTLEFLSIIEYNSLKELINDFRKTMEE